MKKFKRYFRLMNLLFDANWQHSSPEKMKKILMQHIGRAIVVDKDWISFNSVYKAWKFYKTKTLDSKKKDYLASGLVTFFISYLLLSYTKRVIISSLCLIVSLFLIGYGISDMGFYSYKNQYIYLALFMIFVSLVFLIPYEREYLNAYSISMLMLSFAITILVFMSVKTPLTA